MNNGWDKEYSTNSLRELDYLTSQGIKYVFVKTFNGVRVYKYTKTKELFEALTKYYSQFN